MGEGWMIKPKLGLLLLSAGWFRDIGLQESGSVTTSDIAETARRIRERTAGFADAVGGDVLSSVGEAERAARAMAAEAVDAVLLVPLTWVEDAIPRAALRLLARTPLILWSFSPSRSLPSTLAYEQMLPHSGPVGAFQLSGMLKREGVPYESVAGHLGDDAAWREIESRARAAAVARRLRGCRIGVLPFPCDQMSVTYVDELGLRARQGVELRWLELERVRREAAAVPADGIRELRRLLGEAGVAVEVDERNLLEGVRYALALERVAEQERLDGIAVNDVIPEMHASFGLRPCLWNPRLSRKGIAIAMEADVAACVAMVAAGWFTGEPPFYAEPYALDWSEGTILMGHAGYHDGRCADPGVPIRLVDDVEYRRTDRFTGAATVFAYRRGPVTLLNSIWCEGTLHWHCLEGESLPDAIALEGASHFVLRPAAPLDAFVNRAALGGVSQHWIAVPGHRGDALAALGRACGCVVEVLGGGDAGRSGAG